MVKMRTKEKRAHHEGLSISYTRERKTRPPEVHAFTRRMAFLSCKPSNIEILNFRKK
jgi:hypothetical protein